jgi:hypothetical protein
MVDTPQDYRRSATEARRLAVETSNEAAKDNWYAIADDYERRARNFCAHAPVTETACTATKGSTTKAA